DTILKEHAPNKCAREYFEAIESFYSKVINENDGLIDAIVNNDMNIDDNEVKILADSISKNHQYSGEKQLFLDISVIVHGDAKSGIQRVVRSLLLEILKNPPKDFRVMAIYYDETHYRYATSFIAKIFDKPFLDIGDEIVDFRQNDIYLALDLNAHLTHAVHAFHKYLQCIGVKLYFIVYDILLVQRPDWWHEGTSLLFEEWLKSITEVSTSLICISEAVANEVREWMDKNPPKRLSLPEVKSFHLGADVDNSLPSKGLPNNSESVLSRLISKPSFLMVGTVEPRKGHKQTLEAFEKLWQDELDIVLVIIGKEGWLVDDLVKKLRNHPQLNKQLFWLEGISDEYLEKIYASSTCLIAASKGEGFGLPLIEAAQHKIPIIARDIPVFREVAGKYAYYFENNKDSNVITDAVKNWLKLYKQNNHPKSDDMPWLTWEESTKQLLNCLKI
ncbi:MAG: glycosyltransferase family 1 protein, partial [Campylobacterota bacterium]|nr:glycosyltransferase family 1 protein [Campylobacterota bacterium]